jgi:hypothetical protein
MDNLWVIFSPVTKILLIYSPTVMKMRLITAEERCVGSNLFKHVLTQISAAGKVCFVQLLGHDLFVEMEMQIPIQNPPQTA